MPLITDDLVRLDVDLGTDKNDVIRALAGIVGAAGRANDVNQLADDALAREATAAPAAAEPPAPAAATSSALPSLVAVTACPTGIAHTYMAAESLEAAAARAGVTIHVETQGSAGATPLPRETIAAAGAVIFAV